jgi:hypothetical protein
MALPALLAVVLAGTAAAEITIRSAWERRAALDPGAVFYSDCVSPSGHVAVFGRPSARNDRGRFAVVVSPSGEAVHRTLPSLPGDSGTVRRTGACRWLGDDGVLVLAHADKDRFGALWLSSDFSLKQWLVLDAKPRDNVFVAIAEITPGEFVIAGIRDLHPAALLFDRRRVEAVALPWVDGPEGRLTDVVADQDGGFAVCGIEVRHEGGSTLSVEVVVASFDEDRALRAQTRFTGRACRLLSSRSGVVRLLRDDGLGKPAPALLLTTLSPTFESIANEQVAPHHAMGYSIQSFEQENRLFVGNPWYAGETLKVWTHPLLQSFDLEVDPGGLMDILPGQGRVYVLSSTLGRDGDGLAQLGLRVDALDIQTTSP